MKKNLFLLISFLFLSLAFYSQSANDACAGSILVADNGTCNSGNIIAADADNLTGTAGCATTGANGQHKDVWYRFVATNGGISYNVTGAAGTLEMNIFSSTGACAGLAAIGSACGAGPLTGVIGGMVPGNTYYVLMSRPSNATGTFTFCLTTIPPPANDVKCGAIALTPNGASVCATNAGGTSAGDGTGSCFTTENGLWYKVVVATAPTVLSLTADYPSTNFDAQIAIFSSSNNSCTGVFTELACDDNSGSGVNPIATTAIATAGTYFVLIDGFAGATGNFCIGALLETCSDGIQNQNESGIDCGGVCTATCAAGTGYLQPITGLQNANVGTCMVNTCSGSFFDSGGGAGNYAANSAAYRTFCPSTAGQCLRVTFSAFNVDNSMCGGSPCDFLIIDDGPTQPSAPYLAVVNGAGALGPFTSADKSGCLGFWFFSNGSTQTAGWTSVLSCVPCATAAPTSGGPNGTDNNDCSNAITVCANTALTGASTGPGLTSDGCGGCNISENFTSWYKIIVTQSGTMSMIITSSNGTDDYDFALYQASSCLGLGASPIRCTYAISTATTGMVGTETDFNEDVLGNGRVDTLRITAGDIYYLMVNKWSVGGAGFSINWGLSNGGSIACPLPIELLNFDGVFNGKSVDLTWATTSETNNDYFTVEKSLDGQYFKPIGEVDSKAHGGNSANLLQYSLNDKDVSTGIYYYRLTQTDFDKQFKRSKIISVNIRNEKDIFNVIPNPTIGEFEVNYLCFSNENVKITIYDEKGSKVKEEFLDCTEGMNKTKMDLLKEPNGLYLMLLSANNKVYKTKIMKNSN